MATGNGPVRFHSMVCIEVLEHVADPLAALRNMLAATVKELWLSTPNGNGKPKPPSNPHHVREYSPWEIIKMLADVSDGRTLRYQILDWETFKPVNLDACIDLLVYHVELL
jgi:2-polyprenyl-3-methyl-5-hydroxy-6-metoxy-1,4-benzoquinol methylase